MKKGTCSSIQGMLMKQNEERGEDLLILIFNSQIFHYLLMLILLAIFLIKFTLIWDYCSTQ